MDNNYIISNTCDGGEITSEEYGDFIVEFYNVYDLTKEIFSAVCTQVIGQTYSALFSPLDIINERLNAGFYPYYNVPKLYSFDSRPFSINNSDIIPALEASGIAKVQTQQFLSLTGRGVLIGIIDTGVDYRDNALRFNNGDTRIMYIWDQNASGTPPSGFGYGTEWGSEDINNSLRNNTPIINNDNSSHGTLLLKAACGRIESDNIEERYTGAAPDSYIIVVKLKEAKKYLKDYYCLGENIKAYQENDIMAGITYIRNKASAMEMPLVLLMTCNTSMGGHTGSLPLDVLAGRESEKYANCIIFSTGNKRERRHFRGNMSGLGNNEPQTVELRIDNEEGIYMELWGSGSESYGIGMISPSGEVIQRVPAQNAISRFSLIISNTEVIIENKPAPGRDNIRVIIIRMKNPSSGIWRINVYGENIITGIYDIWLPANDFISDGTFFLTPDPDITLTDPATTEQALAVGAVDPLTLGINPASGRGFTRNNNIKPDIVAPSTVGGIVDTGTAIAAGAAAQFMEWAIVRRNSIGVRTDDIRNFFIVGATRERNITYPSTEYGYGRLNIYDSFSLYR